MQCNPYNEWKLVCQILFNHIIQQNKVCGVSPLSPSRNIKSPFSHFFVCGSCEHVTYHDKSPKKHEKHFVDVLHQSWIKCTTCNIVVERTQKSATLYEHKRRAPEIRRQAAQTNCFESYCKPKFIQKRMNLINSLDGVSDLISHFWKVNSPPCQLLSCPKQSIDVSVKLSIKCCWFGFNCLWCETLSGNIRAVIPQQVAS